MWSKDRSTVEAKLAKLNGKAAPAATPEQVNEGADQMIQQIEEDILNGGMHIATGLQNASPEDRQQILDAIQAVSEKYPELQIQVTQEPHRIIAQASAVPESTEEQTGEVPPAPTPAPVAEPAAEDQTEPEEEDETEGVGETGANSAAALLKNKRQQREQAAREASGEAFHTEEVAGGTNVVDTAGTPVTPEPLTQEEADALQQSLDRTRSELDVVYRFMEGASLPQKSEFHQKARAAMEKANAKRETPFESLDEFSKTAKGKSTLKAIATRILKKGSTQEATDAPVVIESPAGEEVPLFETTTTATAASLTFQDFVELDEKLAQFKAKANQDSQEISKFVEEDTSTKSEAPVTKADLVDILRDIHACF
jgi:hypothetical protein